MPVGDDVLLDACTVEWCLFRGVERLPWLGDGAVGVGVGVVRLFIWGKGGGGYSEGGLRNGET